MRIKTRYNILSYYSSDLLDSINNIAENTNTDTSIIVPNIGESSFFKKISQEFPIIKDAIGVQKRNLGESTIIKILKAKYSDIYFCQMYCEQTKSKHRHINYMHLVNCMLQIRNFCFKKNKEDKRVEIHCPKDGLSKHGGRWNTITDLIEDCWINQGLHTFIYRNN